MTKPFFHQEILERPQPVGNLVVFDGTNHKSVDFWECTHEGVRNDFLETLGEGGAWMELGTMGIAAQQGANSLMIFDGVHSISVDLWEVENGHPYDELTDPALFNIAEIPPPHSPDDLIAHAGDQKVTLTWDPDPDAIYFVIRRSLSQSGPFTIISNAMTNSYVDITVQNGTTYYYIVTGVNNGGESLDSPTVSATPHRELPFEVEFMYDVINETISIFADLSQIEEKVVAAISLPVGITNVSGLLGFINNPRALVIQSMDNPFSYDTGAGFSPVQSKFVFNDLEENQQLTLQLQVTDPTKVLLVVAGGS